jgi:hypothetical protein
MEPNFIISMAPAREKQFKPMRAPVASSQPPSPQRGEGDAGVNPLSCSVTMPTRGSRRFAGERS